MTKSSSAHDQPQKRAKDAPCCAAATAQVGRRKEFFDIEPSLFGKPPAPIGGSGAGGDGPKGEARDTPSAVVFLRGKHPHLRPCRKLRTCLPRPAPGRVTPGPVFMFQAP